jgi:hypothetical protein
MAPNIDKGIEMAMMTVERQLPRKRNTNKLVNAAAMAASIATALMAALTKMDWSLMGLTTKVGGKEDLML